MKKAEILRELGIMNPSVFIEKTSLKERLFGKKCNKCNITRTKNSSGMCNNCSWKYIREVMSKKDIKIIKV